MSLFDNCSGAKFSECGKYRYRLWRLWDNSLPIVQCIGLNPSTANAMVPDPTIRVLMKTLKILGYGGFYMTNLFAYVSSRPDVLLTVADPIGENDAELLEVRALCKDVIFCWGTFKEARARASKITELLPGALCFGLTKNGSPCHPLDMMYKGTTDNPKLFTYQNNKQ